LNSRPQIKYLRHHQIDKLLWDQTIDKSPNGLIFGYSWYLDLLAPGWEALVSNNYESVMPLISKRKFGLIPILYQPYFMQQAGVYSLTEIEPGLLQNFLDKIPLKFVRTNVHLNTGNPGDEIPQAKRRTTYQLSLANSYEELIKKYSKDALKNLRKARVCNPVFSKDFNPEPVISLFKQSYGHLNPGIKEEDYQRFRLVLEKAHEFGKCFTLEINDNQGNLLASGAFLNSHGIIHYVMGAATERGRKVSAVHLLIDEVIRLYSGKNIVFDFEGSEIPSVAAFYEKFRPEKAYFYTYSKSLF
jgi:hypothetical protein